jgi:hypothetical protein
VMRRGGANARVLSSDRTQAVGQSSKGLLILERGQPDPSPRRFAFSETEFR